MLPHFGAKVVAMTNGVTLMMMMMMMMMRGLIEKF
jgi:hypothetical protein